MSWLNEEELKAFQKVGKNVLISRDAVFYGKENIQIGSNVRIDTACIFLCSTGRLIIGDHVHLAARSTFLCSGGVHINAFAQVASHCLILSASDDFGGDHLIGPCVPEETRKVYKAQVYIGFCSVIGGGCTISPGTVMIAGSALAAMSMTKKDQELDQCAIYGGVPAKILAPRSKSQFEIATKIQIAERDNYKSEPQSHKPSTDNSQ